MCGDKEKQFLPLIFALTVLLLGVPDAGHARPHTKQQTVKGTIKEFVCGDNCYLTIVADLDGRQKEITGLCVAKDCREWNFKTEMPASNVGRKVIVTLSIGSILTDGDKFDEFAVAFSKINFVTTTSH
jgi:hypothetical protein